MNKYIKWIRNSFFIGVGLVIIISIFNYKIDSLGIFNSSNNLVQVARALTNGNMIAGFKNNDERVFQELIIKNLKCKNDVVAIGSSRTMMLRKRFFLNQKINFFNHFVSSALLTDYISILGVYEKVHGYIPSTVVIGIDPWIFNRQYHHVKWKSLSKYYDYEINKIYNKSIIQKNDRFDIEKWKQLINYEYTFSNIKYFLFLIQRNRNKLFYITKELDIDDMIKEPDGSIHYPYKKRFPNKDSVMQKARKFINGNDYSLHDFNELNTELFEDFIVYLQSKNINIVFFLPPYHPITYDMLMYEEKYINLKLSEEYLKRFCYKYNIKLLGSYNPHKYKFKNKDFFDAIHGKPIVIKKIFNDFKIIK
jgi:hypothetical protein